MSTAWIIVEVVLGMLGSILVWVAIGGAIANLRERHRTRTARASTRPPARS